MLVLFWLFVLLVIFIGMYAKKQHQIKELRSYVQKIEQELGKRQKIQDKLLRESRTSNVVLPDELTDSLTGLPRRDAFEDRVVQALSQSKRHKIPVAIMMINISNFSDLNKKYGHEFGDKIIMTVAKRMQKTIRQIDTLTRFAGGTFSVLLPLLAKPETAAYVAQRIQDIMIENFIIDGKDIQVNVHIGIAVSPNDGDEKAVLFENATKALDQAKLEGASSYNFYRQEIQILSKRELSLSHMFKQPNYLDKVLIYYQPYIDTKTRQVSCIQAIPYFQHQDLKLIRFSELEKIAENAGKILEIGEVVITNSLKQFKKWKEQKIITHKILLDLYLKQIENMPFIEQIMKTIIDENIDPKDVIFLVSEDALSGNPEILSAAFKYLSNAGIQMAVGIFALGHLALQKISHLPFKYLKIDGRLVHNVNNHEANEAILSMLIDLAKASQITVLGEGVENPKQKIMLSQLGCEVMQGRLFCHPLPADSIESFKLVV